MKKSSTILQARLHPRVAILLRFFVALALMNVSGFRANAQLELLKDVDATEIGSYNEYSWLTNAGNHMYFVSNKELWKSNGTTKYTTRMKSFKAISNLTVSNGTLYFTADDGLSGPELWKSNGSPSTTVKVKDIMPGIEGSSPTHLTPVNGMLYFSANTQANGRELWRSDGTPAGTLMVKDISRGSANPQHLANFNGTLYFSATSPTGYELWKSNGTASNTILVKDIFAGERSSNPTALTVSTNTLFFSAIHPVSGKELWITDGTAAGTKLVKDINPGTKTSDPDNLIHANGKLMFTANNGTHGDELWSSDGTPGGTALVRDMNPGPAGSNNTHPDRKGMGHFTNINGMLFFVASRGLQDFIYRSDGTLLGTTIIANANGISVNAPQPEFVYRGGYVFFLNAFTNGDWQYGLYKMPYRGNVITRVKSLEVADPQDYSPVIENEMIFLNGAVIFPGRFSSESGWYGGYELIRSDGTPEGTVTLHDTFAPTMSSQVGEMISVNGIVYSLHYSWLSYTPQLYRTDGTPQGTFELRPERYHYEWEASGDNLYFIESDMHGDNWHLFRTQGTPETTQVMISGSNSDENSRPRGLTDVGGVVYFYTGDIYEGNHQLWKSDGTAQRTVQVGNLFYIHSLTNVNGQAFILAGNQNDGLELWKTTPAGLMHVKTLPNTTSFINISVGGIFYFLADDGINGYQIWRSDGTAGGTYKMFGPDGFQGGGTLTPDYYTNILIEYNDELYLNNGEALVRVSENAYTKVKDIPRIRSSVEFNGKLFLFTGERDSYLYVSDGSAEGTILLNYAPVEYGNMPVHATVGGYLYFRSDGQELWRTDGTLCGTTSVDVGTGDPAPIEGIGNDLVFGGYLLATGTELYVYHNINSIPGNSCEEQQMMARMSNENATEEKIISPYPNPFTESFIMKVMGNDGERVNVAVFTGSGLPVEKLADLPVNTEHINVGATWPKGYYIIRVLKGDKAETYHVIKN